MKRTKSSISLSKLAQSVKQSIRLDQYRSKKKQFIPLRSSASSLNLINRNQHISNDYHQMLTRKSKFLVDDGVFSDRDFIEQNNYQRYHHGNGNNNLKVNKKQGEYTRQTISPIEGLQDRQNIRQNPKRIEKTKRFNSTLSNRNLNNQHHNINSDQSFHALRILEQEQRRLEEQIEEKYSHFSNIKNYTNEIAQIERLNEELVQISKKQTEYIEKVLSIKNRQLFLQEETRSTEINFMDSIVQKQYCQQLLSNYQNCPQYKQQAKIVLLKISQEFQCIQLEQKKQKLEVQIEQLQKEFKDWKKTENIQLKQKKTQNKLKQMRLNLMKIQHDLDERVEKLIKQTKQIQESQKQYDIEMPITFVAQSKLLLSNLRKIRQHICIYFKRYNQLNINHISQSQISDGIDIFLCKEGLIKDFSQYIQEKTSTISKKDAVFGLKLHQFLDILKNIQTLFISQKTQFSRVVILKYQERIFYVKEELKKVNTSIEKYTKNIIALQERLEQHLAAESICVIQCLNSQITSNSSQFSQRISQIKSKVKEMKIQQIKRINMIKDAFLTLKKKNTNSTNISQQRQKNNDFFQKQKISLEKQLNKNETILNQITQIQKGFKLKKLEFQNIVNQGIQNMKEKQIKENQLRALQAQIKKLRKNKISNITQKYNEKRQNVGFLKESHMKSNNLHFQKSPTVASKFEPFKKKTQPFFNENKTTNSGLNNIHQIDKKQQQIFIDQQHKRGKQSTILYQSKYTNKGANKKNPTDFSPNFTLKELDNCQPIKSNIIISKCDLVQSKAMPRKTSSTTKLETHKLVKSKLNSQTISDKQNYLLDDELMLLESYNNSYRGSKSLNKNKKLTSTGSTIMKSNNYKKQIKTSSKKNNKSAKLSLNSNSYKKGSQTRLQNKSLGINHLISSKLLQR